MTPGPNMWVLWVAMATTACSGPGPEVAVELEAATARVASLERQLEEKTAEVTQKEKTIVRLNGELADLHDSNVALKSQVEVLRLKDDSSETVLALQGRFNSCLSELAAARLRYSQAKARVEQALLSGRLTKRRPAAATGPLDRLVIVPQPRVIGRGDAVTVEGTIHNANDQAIAGFLRVVLIAGRTEADSETLPMTIGAGSTDDWNVTFYGGLNTVAVRARAEWNKER